MKKYFIINEAGKSGPFTYDELKGQGLSKHTLIIHDGLSTWEKASELKEFQEILELTPPPIGKKHLNESIEKGAAEEEKKGTQGEESKKKGSKTGIVLGYIFAILGGLFGLGFGMNYSFGNYDKKTKAHGKNILIIAIVSIIIWRTLQKS